MIKENAGKFFKGIAWKFIKNAIKCQENENSRKKMYEKIKEKRQKNFMKRIGRYLNDGLPLAPQVPTAWFRSWIMPIHWLKFMQPKKT